MKTTGYLRLHEEIQLTGKGLTVWAYDKDQKYLGRVEIGRAGLAAFTGKHGGKRLGDMSWKTFFGRLRT